MDSKSKKGDFVVLLDSNAVNNAKFTSTTLKDNVSGENASNSSDKQKKKCKNSPPQLSIVKKENDVMEATSSNNASIYDFEESNGEMNTDLKCPDLKISDKKRVTDTTDEPDRKKTKHSRWDSFVCLVSKYLSF